MSYLVALFGGVSEECRKPDVRYQIVTSATIDNNCELTVALLASHVWERVPSQTPTSLSITEPFVSTELLKDSSTPLFIYLFRWGEVLYKYPILKWNICGVIGEELLYTERIGCMYNSCAHSIVQCNHRMYIIIQL